jgi:catechol 2,3-dioxygenase-like lactoylglutathione lyase family enzyme
MSWDRAGGPWAARCHPRPLPQYATIGTSLGHSETEFKTPRLAGCFLKAGPSPQGPSPCNVAVTVAGVQPERQAIPPPIKADCRILPLLIPLIERREIAMESIISNLLARFEKGSLSRRELVQGLAMLAASGTAATAQEDINFKAANIDHVSVQVADIQRSTDFYRKMFGFTVVSQAEEGGVKIVRLGNTKTLVSLNHGGPPGTVDHFAIGIPRHSRESITSYLTQRGATPLQGNFAGLHVKDPDGVNVQISSA